MSNIEREIIGKSNAISKRNFAMGFAGAVLLTAATVDGINSVEKMNKAIDAHNKLEESGLSHPSWEELNIAKSIDDQGPLNITPDRIRWARLVKEKQKTFIAAEKIANKESGDSSMRLIFDITAALGGASLASAAVYRMKTNI